MFSRILLITLLTLVQSTAFAESPFKCDLVVDPTQTTVHTQRYTEAYLGRHSEDDAGATRLAEFKVMNRCKEINLDDICELDRAAGYCEIYFDWGTAMSYCHAYAVATITQKNKKSEGEVKQERCQKIMRCEESVMNDRSATLNDLQKIGHLQSTYGCR